MTARERGKGRCARWPGVACPRGHAPPEGGQDGRAYRRGLGLPASCGGSGAATVYDIGEDRSRFRSAVAMIGDGTGRALSGGTRTPTARMGWGWPLRHPAGRAAQDVPRDGATRTVLRFPVDSCGVGLATRGGPQVS